MSEKETEMDGSVELSTKRQIKLTAKALQDKLEKQMNLRKRVLARLVSKAEQIENLMLSDSNALLVERDHLSDYSKFLNEFIETNNAVSELLSDDEKQADQQYWSEPNLIKYEDLLTRTEQWIIEVRRHNEAADNQAAPEQAAPESVTPWDDTTSQQGKPADEDINPDDSASNIYERYVPTQSVCSRRSRSSHASSMRRAEEANRAALLARAAALKKKQALQMEEVQMEAQLKAKRIQLKAQMEELDVETAIAEATAKINFLEECDGTENKGDDGMNSYLKMNMQPSTAATIERQAQDARPKLTSCFRDAQDSIAAYSTTRPMPHVQIKNEANDTNTSPNGREIELGDVILKQKDITEMLVTQQRLANLPQRKVPVFSGDPLEFLPFLRAFEHIIHSRTDNDEDRLYYLEQFTSGEPRELVRSCQHMSAEMGYNEARKLLTYHYGNEQKIAAAYVDKAVKWPQIKADDAKSLHSFSIFLTGCNNVMKNMEYLEEMNSPTNLRLVIYKLPFRLREQWRIIAFDIQEKEGRRAKFSDLVKYVNRQAKIASDPLFGDVKESFEVKERSKSVNRSTTGGGLKRTTGFATSVKPEEAASETRKNKQTINVFQEPCLYCNKGHTLNVCNKIRSLPNKERIEFLKGKGLCFGCLTQGHMGKDCKKRATCEICSKKHPSLLHSKWYETADQAKPEKIGQSTPQEEVPANSEVTAATGAGVSDFSSSPPSPTEVFFSSVNLRNVLQWSPGNGTQNDTLYTVQYAIYGDSVEGSRGKRVNWRSVSHCTEVGRHWCDLSNETWDLEQGYHARVQAKSRRAFSKWAITWRRFDPKSDTIFGPPLLSVDMEGNNAIITIKGPMRYQPNSQTPAVSMATIYSQMTYNLSVHNIRRSRVSHFPIVSSHYDYRLMEYDTEYCFSAKTRFLSMPVHCQPSEWHCITTPPDPLIAKLLMVVVGIVVPTACICLLVVVGYFLYQYLSGKGQKSPYILNLPPFNPPPLTFSPESHSVILFKDSLPSEPENGISDPTYPTKQPHIAEPPPMYTPQRSETPGEPEEPWDHLTIDYAFVGKSSDDGGFSRNNHRDLHQSQAQSIRQGEIQVDKEGEDEEFSGLFIDETPQDGLFGIPLHAKSIINDRTVGKMSKLQTNGKNNEGKEEGRIERAPLLSAYATQNIINMPTSQADQSHYLPDDYGVLSMAAEQHAEDDEDEEEEEEEEGGTICIDWDPKTGRLVLPEVGMQFYKEDGLMQGQKGRESKTERQAEDEGSVREAGLKLESVFVRQGSEEKAEAQREMQRGGELGWETDNLLSKWNLVISLDE